MNKKSIKNDINFAEDDSSIFRRSQEDCRGSTEEAKGITPKEYTHARQTLKLQKNTPDPNVLKDLHIFGAFFYVLICIYLCAYVIQYHLQCITNYVH